MDLTLSRPVHPGIRFWRKWLVRTLVFAIVTGLTGAAVIYQRWTNPAAVRQLVLEKLAKEFKQTRINLDSARLRLLGGIALSELRLSRSYDNDRTEFLYVPSAVIYHDKEQLLDGKLSIRKIEMYRPRLHVLRGARGGWNISNLLAPTDLAQQMPTVVIHHGTIVFEDQAEAGDAAPLELKDVNFTLVNDPLPKLTFEATGTSDLAGTVRLKGTRNRQSEETALAITAPMVRVGPALIERLGAYEAEIRTHARQLRGLANLEADLTYRPGAERPLTYDVRCRLSQGEFSHALLPVPLDHLEASVRYHDGAIPLATLSARSGPTTLDVTAKDVTPQTGKRTLEGLIRELECRVTHLVVNEKLFGSLPEFLQDIARDYSPAGVANVTFTLARAPDGRWQKHCLFQAVDMQANYEGFRYPVEQVSGTVDAVLASDQDDLIKIDLAGRAGGQPVNAKGQLIGDKPCAVVLDIWGKNLPLDQTMRKALPPKYQELAGSFHPSGRGDFRAYIRRQRHSQRFTNRFIIAFHDATTRYDIFPYPLENVSGTLDIQPDEWEFRDFHGTHKGGIFRTWGRCYPTATGERLEINIKGSNILLDDEIAQALKAEQPDLFHAWQEFAPAGQIDFNGRVERLAGQPADVELTVLPKGCRIRPVFFPFDLEEMVGRVHYQHRWVELDNLQARHKGSILKLARGTIYLKPGGGLWAELLNLQGRPLVPESDFVKALPPSLQQACLAMQLKDPLTLSTQLVLDSGPEPGVPPVIYWDGWANLVDASFHTGVRFEHVTGQVACRGRHNGHHLEGVTGNFILKQATLFDRQRFEDVHSQIEVSSDAPEIIKLPGLYARYCGGEIYGPLRVELGPSLRYEMKLTASQVQLEEFARQNSLGPDAQLSGLASANLHLSGQGADLNNLRGAGNVSVPEGKMYNLPLLLDLLKVIGLRPPDRTAFEEAQANFEINGPRVHVNHIDLFGNAISLRGEGELNLDGTDINLDFNVDWARIPQMLPAGLQQVPHTISDNLLKIKMRGQFGDLHCTKEPVPMLLDPFRKLWGNLWGDGSDQAAEARDKGPVNRTTKYVAPPP